MHLVKWLRKNNTKIMAIVVVVLMVGFVGGSYIQQFAHRTGRPTETVAYFGQNNKITHNDILQAQQELEILKMVRAEAILRSQDLRALLLGELLFPEHSASAELIGQIQELVKNGGYRISEKQINDIYRGTMSAGTYWMLLKKEVEQAGFKIPNEEAGKVLATLAPKLFGGASYQQVVTSLMKQGISEDDILSSLSSLLTVLQYARVTCSNEDLTSNQIMHEVSREMEKMSVEFVRFDASLFAKNITEPQQQQIEEQFNKYKSFSSGDVNDHNPYGFGYKLPERVQFEYVAVKLDDVARIIPQISSQEMEDYYQRHIDQFTVSYRSDPNDPNSPVIKKPRSYGEVGGIIARDAFARNRKYQSRRHYPTAKGACRSEAADRRCRCCEINVGTAQTACGRLCQRRRANRRKEQHKNIYGQNRPSQRHGHADRCATPRSLCKQLSNPIPFRWQRLFSPQMTSAPANLVLSTPRNQGCTKISGPSRAWRGKMMMLVRVIEAHKAAVPENIDLTFSIC